jgi:hypothetical protein
MSYARDMIEATRFKPAAGGFVFRMPSIWMFGRAEHYLVSEAQKAELLSILAPRRPVLRVLVILLLIALAAGVMVLTVRTFGSGARTMTLGDHMIMAAIAITIVAASLAMERMRGRYRVEQIVMPLLRTDETISYCDRHHAMLGATPLGLKITMLVASSFAFAMQLVSWSYNADTVAAASAVFFGLIMIHEAFTLAQKLLRNRPAS